MNRSLLLLLLSLAVLTTNIQAVDPGEAKVTVSAMAGNSWVWVYVERESDVLVFTLPLTINKGKASGELSVAEAKTEVAVLITGPEAKKHAKPKPPFLYSYRKTVPDDGQHKIITAKVGDIKYTFVPDRTSGSFGILTCDITDLEIPDRKSIDKLHISAEVDSIPP